MSLSPDSVELCQEETLGVGSYGKVCKAKYGQLVCAAKTLHDILLQGNEADTNISRRFEEECKFLGTINHPNIVQYLGTVMDPQCGRPVLLMELMDESLTRFLERSTGPIPYHLQLNICHDVALALSYLHSNAIIHRDLSSNNVLLIGEGSRAKVTDFVMSTLTDMNPRITPLTLCPGVAVYLPPEALTHPPHYSNKLDCFSHGVLTVQILTRNFPDPGEASKYLDDPNFSTECILVQLPETARRKKDIDLIEPDHPLLPMALHCLKDRDTERPSAGELCERLAMLKREERYALSVEREPPRPTQQEKLEASIETVDHLLKDCRLQEKDSKTLSTETVWSLQSNWRQGRYRLMRIECPSEGRTAVYCLQYDDKKIVSGHRDNTIKVWDRKSLSCVKTLRGHTGSVLCLQFNNRVIISGSVDCKIIVWDIGTGKIINTLNHYHKVMHLKFTSNTLVTGSKDKTLVLWEVKSPEDIVLRQALVGHRAAVNVVDLDDKRILSGSGDKTVRVWRISSRTLVHTLRGHRRGVTSLQYSGKHAVSGSHDKTIRLWQVEVGTCLRVLEGHRDMVRCIGFSDEYLVSGDYLGVIRAWDFQAALDPRVPVSKLCLWTSMWEHTRSVFCLQFDHTQIVSGSRDDTILVWDFRDVSTLTPTRRQRHHSYP